MQVCGLTQAFLLQRVLCQNDVLRLCVPDGELAVCGGKCWVEVGREEIGVDQVINCFKI